MNKADLVKAVSESADIAQARVELTVNAIFLEMAKTLVAGEEVVIREFGTFAVKPAKARASRNLLTGEPIQIPACNKVKFKPSKSLKDAIQ